MRWRMISCARMLMSEALPVRQWNGACNSWQKSEAIEAARRRFEGQVATPTIIRPRSRRAGQCVGRAVLDRYGRVLARVEGWAQAILRWDKGPWCR